ncbi:MAG: tetratricopeptide repeat protein [Prevotella sp.]|nr:tetratricopeptide repeat protein [Prevotella sp.]
MKAFRLTLLTFVALLILAACQHHGGAANYTEAERDVFDSITRSAKDTTAARALVETYRQSGNTLGQIVALRQLGKLYRENSQFMEAIDCHQLSLQLAIGIRDTVEMIQALNNIGTNYRRLGSLEQAANYHQQAIMLCSSLNDQTSERASRNKGVSLNGMGNVLMGLGNAEQADRIFQQALQGERAIGNKRGQAINLANIGSIKRQLGQIDSARYYYQQSLEMNQQINSTLGIGLCHIRFGELDEQSGQLEKAINEYQTAYQLLEHVGDDWHWLDAVLNVAHLYILQGNVAEARTYLDMAGQTVERMGSQDYQVRVYRLRYELYEKTGNIRQALDNYILADALEDSLVNIKTVTNVQNQRIASERMRQERQLQQTEDKLALEHSENTTLIVIIIATLLLAAVIIILMWYFYRTRTAKQRIRQQMQQAREDFFTSLAHDFRTPLSTIINTGHQLEEQELTNERQVRQAAKMIVRQGNSLMGLIDKMLNTK